MTRHFEDEDLNEINDLDEVLEYGSSEHDNVAVFPIEERDRHQNVADVENKQSHTQGCVEDLA